MSTVKNIDNILFAITSVSLVGCSPKLKQSVVNSHNPIIDGWYADPEAHIFQNQYWIYPTYSAPYDEQVFMDAFSSKDLVTWTRHGRVLDKRDVEWARSNLLDWEARHRMNTGPDQEFPLADRYPHVRVDNDDLGPADAAERIVDLLDLPRV